MKVYIVYGAATVDVANELIEYGDIRKVFSTYEKADDYYSTLSRTYNRSMDDWDIIEMAVE